jgi:hypothetical protein
MAESTFSRDSLSEYEKGPQVKVSDKVNPFRGAKPAQAADAAAVAAVASGQNLDATPGGAPAAAAAAPDVSADDPPVVDEDGTLGDPTESGEGTLDEPADPSPAIDDPDVVADPAADLTGGEPVVEEPVAQAPAKGSAQERIVELVDRLEGTTIFAKSMQDQLKATLEENARLRAGAPASVAVPPAARAPTPPVAEEVAGPMPSMADPDIAYDDDKYREKMTEWSKKNARIAAREAIREMSGVTEAQRVASEVDAKVDAYAKDHPEFKETVIDNQVLKANQLHPIAGQAVAKSPYTAELLMKFGQDPAFAIRVAKMSPDQQLMTVGELVADIKAEKKAAATSNPNPKPPVPSKTRNPAPQGGAKPVPQKSISNAPPPPRPTVGGGRVGQFNPLEPNTTMADFVAEHRKGKEAARAANRRQRGLS